MRQNGWTASNAGKQESETLKQFLNRFALAHLKPVTNVAIVESAQPIASPDGTTQPTPTTRGAKRGVPSDGGHAHESRTKASKGNSLARVPEKKACLVCKHQKRRMDDKQKSWPMTKTYCGFCEGFVHGRNAGGADGRFNGCWDFHLKNCISGLRKSGEL